MDVIQRLFESAQSSFDLNRTILYKEQKNREKEKHHFTSVEDYNLSLETQFDCYIADHKDLSRLSELSFRTHQFNLSASSYTEEELTLLINDTQVSIFCLSAKDKYGDMGIVGMAIVRADVIESFMLSCRVFDRNFELQLLGKIKKETSTHNITWNR